VPQGIRKHDLALCLVDAFSVSLEIVAFNKDSRADVHECAASAEIKSVPQCDRQSSILES
jgi:hypothetical protein